MALAECGTHAIFAAEIGRYAESEATLVGRLLDRLVPGMLLTADRGFFSYALGRKATATGAELLWRIRTDKAGPKPTHVADLPDGSWLAHLRLSTPASARREEPMLVRVPAHRAPQRVPDLALQEIWGHLCCHSAIRSLMTQAATTWHDPDRISFVAALRISRQTLAHPGAFPPDAHGRDSPGWLNFLRRLFGRLNPVRRQCSAPRVIKRTYVKWHVKRAHHANWPQPQHPPTHTDAAH